MSLGGLIVLVAILAPGWVAFRRLVMQGLHAGFAAAVGILLSMLWAMGVLMILAATRHSVIPDWLWVALVTALVLVEVTERTRGP